jgi:TolB protein
MRGDGSNPEQVISLASEPSFSADGNRMVYYRWIEGLRVIFLNREPQEEIVSRGDGNASFPSMSPDGAQIVYHQIPPTRTGQFTIRICNVDGQNDRFVTPGSRPAWSPKGGLIAYDSCQNNNCGIFVIQPNGQGLRQLTTDVGHGPAWSPDGQRLAYATAEDGDFEIFVINLDGSGKRQLTQNKGNDVLPAWSPDGNFVYYRSDNNGRGWSIMIVGADGSNPRKLVDAPACDLWAFEKLAVTR